MYTYVMLNIIFNTYSDSSQDCTLTDVIRHYKSVLNIFTFLVPLSLVPLYSEEDTSSAPVQESAWSMNIHAPSTDGKDRTLTILKWRLYLL